MQIVVDTSVWIGHFRVSNLDLVALLDAKRIVRHSVVVGELAVGGLRDRQDTLIALCVLPAIIETQPAYCLDFIERHRLFGIGLSWGDVQILASADLSGIPIWTLDQRLLQQAVALNLSWMP